jgi:hypothetical protein
MTNITTTNLQVQPKTVKITESIVGKWYKVASYLHGDHFNGEIGVIINLLWEEGDKHRTPSLITPRGTILNNPEFILQELDSVEVTYK